MSALQENDTIYNTIKDLTTCALLITSPEGHSQVLFDLPSATPDQSQCHGTFLS